ncbi:MAG: hypothetical protein OSB75_05095 [Dehalococcoidia bacterium]|nr:hypothetical protein [Dehalococcoidia bacterium]
MGDSQIDSGFTLGVVRNDDEPFQAAVCRLFYYIPWCEVEFWIDHCPGIRDGGLDISTLGREDIEGEVTIWGGQNAVAISTLRCSIGRNRNTEQAVGVFV